MQSKIFLQKDWRRFTATQYLNIQKFINKNAIDNESYSSVYEYLKAGCDKSEAISEKWDLGEVSLSESEVYNAILEFKKICYERKVVDENSEYNMADLINPLLNALQERFIKPESAKNALSNSEAIIGNIMLYFGFDEKYLKEHNNNNSAKPRATLNKMLKGGNYSKFDEMFRWFLQGFNISFPPFTVARLCRNMIHPQDMVSCDLLYGKRRLLKSKIPEEGKQSIELVEFLVYTYIGVIAICRKLLNKLTDDIPVFNKDILSEDNVIHYCKMVSKGDGLNAVEREELACSISSYIKNIKDNLICYLSQFTPGETLSLEIHGTQMISSVNWILGNNRCVGNMDKTDLKLTGAFRYEPIEINVVTDKGTIRFNKIKLDCSHNDNITIVLDCDSAQYEIRSVDREVHLIEAEEERVSLKVKTDLDGTLMVGTTSKYIAKGQYVEVKVPKGECTLTLTSAKNRSYSLQRTINVIGDTTLNLSFADEVKDHREWWTIEDIVVLKYTDRGFHYFVLWDRTVDIPVYKCNSYGAELEVPNIGFTGNLFYAYDKELGLYRYHDLSDPHNDQIYAGHLFAFENGYELTGHKGSGHCLVIDEKGKTLFTIFRYDDWNDDLKSVYRDFVQQFKFGDNWAAMLQKDGTIKFINRRWIVDESHSYNYDPDLFYPVFHNGYCAVQKGEKFVFLKDCKTFIKELPEEYESLRPEKFDGDIIYIAKLNGKYGIIDSGLEKIHSFEYDKITVRDEHYIVFDGTNNKVAQSCLCIKGKTLVEDYSKLRLISDLNVSSPRLIAVKSAKLDKWSIFSSDGKMHMDNLNEVNDSSIAHRGKFAVQKNGVWEVWKIESGVLSKVMEASSGKPVNYLPKVGVYRFRDVDDGKEIYRYFNEDGVEVQRPQPVGKPIIANEEKYGDDFYIVNNDGVLHLIDSSEQQISNEYCEIGPLVNGYARVKDIAWGFVRYRDGRFEEIRETEYYQVKDFTAEGYAMVQNRDGKWGLIDTDGNLVVQCHYDHIDPFRCGYTSVKDGRNWRIIDKEDNKEIKINVR